MSFLTSCIDHSRSRHDQHLFRKHFAAICGLSSLRPCTVQSPTTYLRATQSTGSPRAREHVFGQENSGVVCDWGV